MNPPPGYYKKRRKESPYFKSEQYRQNLRERVARYQKKNKAKKNCRVKLYQAVRDGKVIRPDHCTKCGLICKPEAHHPDHSKPYEVIWVCKDCHVIEDQKLTG